MTHTTKLAGLVVLAAVSIVVVGCSHGGYEGTAYGPAEGYNYDGGGYYYGDGYYDGYYHGHHYYDQDHDRYGYHIQRDYDDWHGHNGVERHDADRNVGHGGGMHGDGGMHGGGGAHGGGHR